MYNSTLTILFTTFWWSAVGEEMKMCAVFVLKGAITSRHDRCPHDCNSAMPWVWMGATSKASSARQESTEIDELDCRITKPVYGGHWYIGPRPYGPSADTKSTHNPTGTVLPLCRIQCTHSLARDVRQTPTFSYSTDIAPGRQGQTNRPRALTRENLEAHLVWRSICFGFCGELRHV